MPRRKRTTAQNERQRKVRRTDNTEDTLVISDSENEEEDDCSINSSSRAARWRERESRVQIQDMTEDEMLDLAMRLSKQEANTAAQRQQLEDDDMRKAIAESLHVSHCQDSDADSEPINPMPKPHQDSQTVVGRFRCKLSFPNKNEMHSANSGDHAAVGVSGVDDKQEASPLPPMPDLSQKTLSHPPSLCSIIPSVPSTSSQQECPSSQWKDEALDADSSEDKPSQSSSQLERSPVFHWQSSTHLGQDMPNASGSPLSTHDHTPDLTQPNSFQLAQPPSPPKSPVFAKTDPKGGTKLSGNKDGDIVRSPNKEEENAQEPSSHKSPECRDRRKRLSLYRKAQPLTRVPVPDGNDGGTDVGLKQEALAPNQRKDESTHGTSINSVFERLTNSGNMLPEQSFQDLTTHMILHLSDDDDDDDDDEEGKVVVPSPVFHQESVSRARPPNPSPTQSCSSLLTATTTVHTLGQSGQESNSQDVLHRISPKTPDPAESDQSEAPRKWGVQDSPACDSQLTDARGEDLVSYYWGVPFCPRGQNPDDYTRVILSQLEVYEKSLKAAQRGLLHKMDWGLPVFPCPVERSLSRRLKRHRAPRLLGEDEEDDCEERQQQEERKKAEEAEEERVESQAGSDVGAGNGPSEPYVVVSSPEAQDELTQKSPLLFGQPDCMDAFKPSRKPSPRDHSPVQQPDEYDEGQQKQCDVESIVCPETQLTGDSTPELMVTSPVQPQSRADSEVMDVEEEGSAPAVDDERMEQERAEDELRGEPFCPPSPTVACPMCGRFFPRSRIEVHAAYCDGTAEQREQQVPVRRKRTGKMAMGGTSPRSEKSEGQEKCYVCLKFFSHEEYVKHIEQCLQQKTSRPNQGNGLLVALDQTEKGHVDDYGAGPSDAIQHNRGLADPLAVAEAGGSCSASNFCVGSSPIKSFTPVSEATDCLIDFKQQYSARPSQRLGRKRKFKR